MGLLSGLFGNSTLVEGWKEISTIEDLDAADEASQSRPVVLFKHSVTCGISNFAKQRIEGLPIEESFEFYYLDLLAHRDVSNEIAKRYGVIHQSPQIIIIRNGESIFDTSHHAISPESVSTALSA